MDAHAVKHEPERARAIVDLYAALVGAVGEHLDETRAAADGFHGKSTPEFELALDLERLAAIDRDETYAFLAQPTECIETACDQELNHVGIGAVFV